jgi:hypothetical protein
MIFPVYEVNFEKSTFDESITATGEIKNDSSRDYNLAMFRIIIYNRNRRLGSGIIKLYDFRRGMSKSFRTYIPITTDIKVSMINRHEVMIEGGY